MEARLTLKQMILNVIDNQTRGYAEILAPIAGYSNGSNLKKVLRNEEKEFDNFNGLVNLVRYLFPEDELKLMEEYSKTLDPCNKSSRCMLEYLAVNRLLDSMKELIEKMNDCKNKESREFAKVYSIHLEWQTNYYNLNNIKFLNNINKIKTDITELKVKLNLLKFYGFYHQQNYKMAYEFSKFVDGEIDSIKDDYIRTVYKTRYNEAISYIYLRVFNNPEESRKRSEEVINDNITFGAVSYAHYNIGCSYLFTSYEKSLQYFNESIRLYKSANRDSVVQDIMEKIDILNVIWDKTDEINTTIGKSMLKAKRGIAENLDLEPLKNEIDNAYYLLIRGIKENSIDHLMQSLIKFLKNGDTFMGNLPKIELLKRNFNEDTLNALISLNCA